MVTFWLVVTQPPPGKLKEWSLVLYGTSVHPYSSMRSDKPRSAEPPADEEFTEEYNGEWGRWRREEL